MIINNNNISGNFVFLGLSSLLLVGSFFYNIFIINKLINKESKQYEINKELLNILNKYVDNSNLILINSGKCSTNEKIEKINNSESKTLPVNYNKIRETKDTNENKNKSIKQGNYIEELKMILDKRKKI